LNVFQGFSNKGERPADQFPQVWLGERKTKVPLCHAAGLNHIRISAANGIHDGFLTSLDHLLPQLVNKKIKYNLFQTETLTIKQTNKTNDAYYVHSSL
jgi:hypothetical protein